jgi:hypothetical protein
VTAVAEQSAVEDHLTESTISVDGWLRDKPLYRMFGIGEDVDVREHRCVY